MTVAQRSGRTRPERRAHRPQPVRQVWEACDAKRSKERMKRPWALSSCYSNERQRPLPPLFIRLGFPKTSKIHRSRGPTKCCEIAAGVGAVRGHQEIAARADGSEGSL